MAAENYILTFAADVSALVLDDGDYAADSERVIGNQPGTARPDLVNKALLQSSYMAAVLAQFIVDYADESVYDSDPVATGVTNLALALALTTGFPSGTKMPFFQAAAPTYWTQDTTYNDMALRVVSGAGGGIGGTHNLSSPPSLAHVHAGPSHVHTTPSHTLTVDEMPSHLHTGGAVNSAGYGGGSSEAANDTSTGLTGGGLPHEHGDTGASGTANTGSTTPTAFAPKYVDVIICTKN